MQPVNSPPRCQYCLWDSLNPPYFAFPVGNELPRGCVSWQLVTLVATCTFTPTPRLASCQCHRLPTPTASACISHHSVLTTSWILYTNQKKYIINVCLSKPCSGRLRHMLSDIITWLNTMLACWFNYISSQINSCRCHIINMHTFGWIQTNTF